ncbi:unnamed protein product [Sordaria macrospora k-hell]|uniref:WGS project CABT00000000 data, contig 2.9 n=1 Tax=Sordaria macrospora (strain ATCC MYA-333 / DSM 997 / K(L3346) / K-hell) TaxID=771870 RepID=F7VVG4_SORMK|nr:uncharacterized protein SMAC_03536 [Sordaria macrospora k-hell]CCC09505.1 unnamed protein product [Sordaria macrospora k-hell]
MIRLSQLPWGLAAAIVTATWLPSNHVAASPSVDVALKAAFPSPPYLVELLETAASENATAYFPLLNRIAKGDFAQAKSDQELYEKFLEVLQQDGHVNHEALSTFKLALSLRSAAPRVEAHYQYYTTDVEPSVVADQDGCDLWFLYNGKQYCKASLEASHGDVDSNSQERTLPFDRKFGSGPQEIVLYADITSPAFGKYHETSMELARKGEASYRLRYKRSLAQSDDALSVNGYGVELTLKRTDYIVIDDRNTGADKATGDDSQKTIKSDSELVLDEDEEVADIKPLEKSELSPLAVKAASFVMQSDSPFDTLLKLTQDFPKYSTKLGKHNVSKEFLAEHEYNRQLLVASGANVLWMNGVQLVDRQVQPFGLVDMLRRERKLINGALDLGLTGQQALSLLGHDEVAAAKATEEEPRRFDWRDESEGGQVIIWLNNIEKDKRYAEYAPSVWALIQHYGQGLPQVRKDLFNLVVPVDFTKADHVTLVTRQLLAFMKRGIPVRFGLVPLTPTGEAIEQAKVLYHLLNTYGLAAMSTYLEKSLEASSTDKPNVDIFNLAIKDREVRPEHETLAFKDIFTSGDLEKQVHRAKHWCERLRADTEIPPAFINGFAIPREEDWLRNMNHKLMVDLQVLQQAVYYNKVNDHTDVPGFFLENAIARRNTFISPEDPNAIKVLNVNKVYSEHQRLFSKVPVIEADDSAPKEDWAVLTIVTDLDSVEGQKLLYFALRFRQEHQGVRLDIIHNPADLTNSPSVMSQRLKTKEGSLLEVTRLVELETILEEGKPEADQEFDADLAIFLSGFDLKSGDNMLILNGRIVGPIASANDFVKEDFAEFLKTERANRILPVYKAIEDLGLGDKVSGPLAAAKLTSVTALSGIPDTPQGIFDSATPIRTTAYNRWNTTYTSFEVGNPETASIFFVAAINPASQMGQKWAPILKVLSELEGVNLQVFVNPETELSELPVKRFYRYVLESAPSFDESGKPATDKSVSETAQHAEINIFSVASGHLYERMLSIMILSVMKHTTHTVKFWFIEQFLSPSFKSFLPFLAAEYGFQYEMVAYKWPHWLRHQSEKQREIWGYKILFLDVLFPLSLEKVIFVDADQIVRTDMYDLVQLDLEGAPYGFTPMCDSRTEMEGFRFWKTGYWATYLRGQPYHISALYVVDLRRFRELAAGDRLRQQYHTLSADPNSLANLDQDLPNHMQFQIPIKSLPQEWLWCETWCNDETLGKARTIDLCNNPQTKEPKLDRARRQVPEWTVYDEEVAGLAKKVREEQEKLEQVVELKKKVEEKNAEDKAEKEHVIDEL